MVLMIWKWVKVIQQDYGIDRLGNSEELVKAGAVKVFPDLREFYRYFSK